MPRFGAIEFAEPRGDKAFVRTKPCVVCEKQHEFLLDREDYERWQTDTKIQDALPELSVDDRETLISGTCGPCFDKMFPPDLGGIMAEGVFYEEDGNEIIDAITYLIEHKNVPRMDVKLEGAKIAKVYWAGTVLRIDIEGLK